MNKKLSLVNFSNDATKLYMNLSFNNETIDLTKFLEYFETELDAQLFIRSIETHFVLITLKDAEEENIILKHCSLRDMRFFETSVFLDLLFDINKVFTLEMKNENFKSIYLHF